MTVAANRPQRTLVVFRLIVLSFIVVFACFVRYKCRVSCYCAGVSVKSDLSDCPMTAAYYRLIRGHSVLPG